MRHRLFFPRLFFFVLISSPLIGNAQSSSRYSVGLNIGTFIYNGDLSPWRSGSWKTPGFVWGLSGHRTLTPTWSARLELNFGKLRGDEAKYVRPEYHQYRAFAFNSSVTEIVVAVEWSPLGRAKRLFPYAFAGVGYAGMRISRDYSRFNAAYFVNEPLLKEGLAADAATALPDGVAIFPAGLGLQYKLSEKFSLNGEAAHRFTRSDYVDGFSQSANPKLKDSHTKYSIGLRMSFGTKDPFDCPPMRY